MWAAILLCVVPIDDGAIRDAVDVIEVEHVYSDNGKLTFTQVILWEVDRWTHRETVVAWRMVKGDPPPMKRGVRWWYQWDERTQVSAPSYRVSHSQTDHELEARQIRSTENRRGLRKR